MRVFVLTPFFWIRNYLSAPSLASSWNPNRLVVLPPSTRSLYDALYILLLHSNHTILIFVIVMYCTPYSYQRSLNWASHPLIVLALSTFISALSKLIVRAYQIPAFYETVLPTSCWSSRRNSSCVVVDVSLSHRVFGRLPFSLVWTCIHFAFVKNLE